jgi:rhodanese-related sulfurtransferase
MIKSISAVELQEWIKAGEAVVVDVREPHEYEQGHIAEATLLPLSRVFAASLPPFQGKKLVMHCEHGVRSRAACERLVKEIPDLVVYNLEGGFHAWKEAGH